MTDFMLKKPVKNKEITPEINQYVPINWISNSNNYRLELDGQKKYIKSIDDKFNHYKPIDIKKRVQPDTLHESSNLQFNHDDELFSERSVEIEPA